MKSKKILQSQMFQENPFFKKNKQNMPQIAKSKDF